jgi:hypothetical protein
VYIVGTISLYSQHFLGKNYPSGNTYSHHPSGLPLEGEKLWHQETVQDKGIYRQETTSLKGSIVLEINNFILSLDIIVTRMNLILNTCN